jgi:hypothetical protein
VSKIYNDLVIVWYLLLNRHWAMFY